MHITPFEIYCIMQADCINAMIMIFLLISVGGMATSIIFMYKFTDDRQKTIDNLIYSKRYNANEQNQTIDEEIKKMIAQPNPIKKYLYMFGALTLLYIFGIIFMPSTNTLAAMYIIPNLTNSQLVQKIPAELQQYITKFIDSKTST